MKHRDLSPKLKLRRSPDALKVRAEKIAARRLQRMKQYQPWSERCGRSWTLSEREYQQVVCGRQHTSEVTSQ